MNPAHEGRGSLFCVHAALPHAARFFFSHGRRLSALCYAYTKDVLPCVSCRAVREASLRLTASQRAVRHLRYRPALRCSESAFDVSCASPACLSRETATPSFRVRCNRVTKRSTRRPNASGPHIGTHGYAVSQRMQRPTRGACAQGETQARRHAGRQGHDTRGLEAYAAPWDTT